MILLSSSCFTGTRPRPPTARHLPPCQPPATRRKAGPPTSGHRSWPRQRPRHNLPRIAKGPGEDSATSSRPWFGRRSLSQHPSSASSAAGGPSSGLPGRHWGFPSDRHLGKQLPGLTPLEKPGRPDSPPGGPRTELKFSFDSLEKESGSSKGKKKKGNGAPVGDIPSSSALAADSEAFRDSHSARTPDSESLRA